MTDFHRDFTGELDEPIHLWNNRQLEHASRDVHLTPNERLAIERVHGRHWEDQIPPRW